MRMKTATTSAQNFLREQVAAVLIRVQALAGSAEQKQGRHGNRCPDAGADGFGRYSLYSSGQFQHNVVRAAPGDCFAGAHSDPMEADRRARSAICSGGLPGVIAIGGFDRPHQSCVNKSSRVFEARSLLIVAATQHNLHAVNVLTTFAMRGP